MAKRTVNTVKLGLFIITGLLLFIIGVYLIGSRQNMFGATLRISSIFGNVNGLQPGNNVRYSGINIGTVEEIVLVDDSTVQVNMRVDAKVQPFIRKNAIASIGSDGLVGSMLVNISPRKGEAGSIEDGDRIQSYSRVETDELLNTLGKTNENIALISNDLLRITKQMSRGNGTIALLLRDSLMAESLRQSVAGLRRSASYLATTGYRLNQLIDEVEEGDGLLSQLLYDTTVITNLNRNISEVDSLAARIEPALDTLQHAADAVAASSATLQGLLAGLEEGKGAAGLLLQDTAVADDIRRSLKNIEEGTARFNVNMEAMRENFLFRRYFKKLEKARKQKGKD